ncbi:hypothetical protein Ahy_B06g084229 [Arachis hypogaea]|uniref:Aminotransferase-like plant mobile domain-containing protein n=1 Tax=Arachis hypogaea TaxID=3818 RepID=A0A444YRE7_ARAHY|nr:hypothetical protein Ahy_B06g084229 [Arachis hypogaea]
MPRHQMAGNNGDMYWLNGIAHVAEFIDERVMPANASEATVQVYVHSYIMMLLFTMLFGDKFGARYSWGSATLSWLYKCFCRVANRNFKNLARPLALLQSWIFWRFPTSRPRGFDTILWLLASRYLPSSDEKGPRVIATRHRLDRLSVVDIKYLNLINYHIAVHLDPRTTRIVSISWTESHILLITSTKIDYEVVYECIHHGVVINSAIGDKSRTCLHIRWLPYVARLENLGRYRWGSAAHSWLYRCMCRVANRHVIKLAGLLQLFQSWIFCPFLGFRPGGFDTFHWSLVSRWLGYQPTLSKKGPRVAH